MRCHCRLFAPLLLVAAAAVLPACSSSITSGLVIPDGSTAVGLVTGESPIVTLHNKGPGELDAMMEDGTGKVIAARLRARQTTGRTLRGPVRLTFQNKGLEQAIIHVEAQQADGLELKLLE